MTKTKLIIILKFILTGEVKLLVKFTLLSWMCKLTSKQQNLLLIGLDHR